MRLNSIKNNETTPTPTTAVAPQVMSANGQRSSNSGGAKSNAESKQKWYPQLTAFGEQIKTFANTHSSYRCEQQNE